MSELIAGDGGSLLPIDGIQAGPLLDSMKIVMKGDGGGTGEPQSLADFLKDRDPNEPLPGDLEFVTDAGHLLIPASQATPGFIADVQHLLSHYRHLPAREQKVALDRVLKFHFTMTPIDDGHFTAVPKPADEAGQVAVENITGQDLANELQEIVTDPTGQKQAALKNHLLQLGFSEEQIKDAFQLLETAAYSPDQTTLAAFNPSEDWSAQGKTLSEIRQRIAELKTRLQPLKEILTDTYLEARYKEDGRDGWNKLSHEEQEDRLKEALKKRLGENWRRIYEELDIDKEVGELEELEKKLLEGGNDVADPAKFKALVRILNDFMETFPVSIPAGLAIAMLAYLLSRRRKSAAT